MNTTHAIIKKFISSLINKPYLIATAGAVSVAVFITNSNDLKSIPPRINPTGGIITLSTSDFTSAVEATPIRNAIASARTLYCNKNSLNSAIIFIFLFSANQSPLLTLVSKVD